jgi:hypothetical protein
MDSNRGDLVFREQLAVRLSDTLPLCGTEPLLELDLRAVPNASFLQCRIVNIEAQVTVKTRRD